MTTEPSAFERARTLHAESARLFAEAEAAEATARATLDAMPIALNAAAVALLVAAERYRDAIGARYARTLGVLAAERDARAIADRAEHGDWNR